MKRTLLSAILMAFLSTTSFSQTHDLPEPQMATGGPNPPPPGLVVPIDKGTPWLAAAGIVLGVVLLKKKKD